jgi:glycosyltransferase involved in cell wall biosynthesis
MKIKLVFVIESLHLGGAEKSLVTLLQNLDTDKYEIDLITFHKEGFFKEFVPKEINQKSIPFPSLSFLNRVKYAFKRKFIKDYHHAQLFWPIIAKYFKLQETSYDIAIAYNQGFATYFVNDYIKASKKIAWLNIDYKIAGYNINFDFNFYKNYYKVIAVSEEAKKGLEIELKKIKKELTIDVIKDIVDKEIVLKQSIKIQEIAFKPNIINLVTVCRLAKQKGLYLLIETTKLLKDKGYFFNWYVVGEGEERKFLENQIKENKLEDFIFLVGATNNPYPYMKNCDIYIQTSLFEGLGLTVVEASYLSKPIVCTNFPTAFSILKNEETGLICEMNAQVISEAIIRLIVDEELRHKLIYNLSLKENSDKRKTLKKMERLLVV